MSLARHYRLLAIAQSYCPTGKEQADLAQLVNKALLDGASDRDMEMMLVGIMADGLKYGNWPWTTEIRNPVDTV